MRACPVRRPAYGRLRGREASSPRLAVAPFRYASLRLRFTRTGSEFIERKDPMTGKVKKFPYGNKTQVKVVKNKLDGTQGQTGEFFIRYGFGLDNYDAYEAKILGRDPGVEWSGYFAVNVIGAVAAADMAKSKYVKIAESPSGVPFVGFTELHLDETKTGGFDLFRLAQSKGTLLVSQRVVDALKQYPRPGGWGITVLEVGEED